MTAWTDTLPTIVAGAKVLGTDSDTLRDAIGGITDPWISYSPSWTGSGGNPAIGNGSISGAYLQSGKFVHATANITMGSTTTYGSGSWSVSLPVTAAGTGLYVGFALIFDASLDTNKRAGCAFLATTSTVSFVADGLVSSAVPYTWAQSDVLRFSITYEAA